MSENNCSEDFFHLNLKLPNLYIAVGNFKLLSSKSMKIYK